MGGNMNLQKEVSLIFQRAELSPEQRISQFLNLSVDGRSGCVDIRQRKSTVIGRLAKLSRKIEGHTYNLKQDRDQNKIHWVPRKDRWTSSDRDTIRAARSNDNAFALLVAYAYHKNIDNLYRSKRAEVVLGYGGQADQEYCYAKSYGFPAKWKNAGVYVRYNPNKMIIQNHLGNTKAQIPLPNKRNRKNIVFIGLTYGDLWGIKRVIGKITIIERVGWNGKDFTKNGVALQYVTGRWKDGIAYEHGSSIKEIKAEFLRKQEILAQQTKLTKLTQRIARLCPKLIVTIEDARNSGYCFPGINGFKQKYGLEGDQIEAKTLKALNDNNVQSPILKAAERVSKLIIEKRRGFPISPLTLGV